MSIDKQRDWLRIVSALTFAVGMSMAAGAVAQAAASAEALPPEEEAEARMQFEKGLQRYEEKMYAEAADHFTRAYELSGEVGILYNIGRCHEAREQNGLAIESYRLYLEKNPHSADREEIEARITVLEKGDNYSEASRYDTIEVGGGFQDDNAAPKKHDVHFGLYFNIGPGFTITSPQLNSPNSSRHGYVAAEVWAHVFFRPWFALIMGVVVGGFIEGDSEYVLRDATAHLGAGAGVAIHVPLKANRLTLPIRVAAIPTAVNRDGVSTRATWFDFQGAVGLAIHLPQSWFILVEGSVDAGPCWIYNREPFDPWVTGLYMTAGARVGAMVKF